MPESTSTAAEVAAILEDAQEIASLGPFRSRTLWSAGDLTQGRVRKAETAAVVV
jgi:hypothetical protein